MKNKSIITNNSINTTKNNNCLDIISYYIATDSKDYSIKKRDIFLYGVVLGWSNDIFNQFVRKKILTRNIVNEIKRYREQYLLLEEHFNKKSTKNKLI